jgi:phosphate transport system substrate-binding protein
LGNTPLAPGVTLSGGRYVIDKALGKGGMGSIFLAHDTRLDDKPVVIKEMLHDFSSEAERIEAEEAFKGERKTLSALRHPGIPQITDFPTESNRFFIVQDYVDGEDLQKKVDAAGGKGLPEKQVLQWASQVLSVLDYLEQQDPQVIHRDIKPANILVDSAGRVKVVDFGVASHRFRVGGPGASQGASSTAMGTPGYAPREQFTGQETPQSDLYALGATVHQLLTGRNPQGATPLFSYPPIRQLNPSLSEATARIVSRALQNDPRQRWPSAAAMKDAIDDLLRPKTLLSSTRGKVTAAALLLVLLLVVGAGATIYGTRQGEAQLRGLVPAVINVGASAAAIHLNGAGSSFAAPFLSTALNAYGKSNPIGVTYTSSGSGTGITLFTTNKIDFGATDVPMNAVELAVANGHGSGVLQLPILLGAVAVAYNLDLPHGTTLRLDGPTLASIYLGSITRWNDPRIAALNPGVALPDQGITVVHRSDSSGTTYIFTDYLSTVSNAWALRVGRTKAPTPWPAGIGVSGNADVGKQVKATRGAIGYVELKFAIDNNLSFARIPNRAGVFVLPNADSVLAAANQFPGVTAANFSIVNAPGKASYPICGYTWGLVRAYHANMGKGAALIQLFHWLITAGQSYTTPLNYVPLPQAVQQRAADTLDKVRVG